MPALDLRSRSLWMETSVGSGLTSMSGAHECDTVIVGAGIAGLSTAYELALAGQKVIVIDRGQLAGGMTARTTAHLAPLCDDLTSEMAKLRGDAIAKAFYESQAAAIDRIEEIQRKEAIDCDFRRLDGYLFQADEAGKKIIEDEYEAVQKTGAPVHRIVGIPLSGCEGRHALKYPRQATFHPLRYLQGLVARMAERGARFFVHSPVQKVEEEKDRVHIHTADGRITAQACVVATNSPVCDMFALHTKMAPYRTYAMAFELPRGAIPDALYWDTEEPYNYIRIQPGSEKTDQDFLIIGGKDHKSGEANDSARRFAELTAYATALIPRLGKEVHRWSGQVLDTLDYAAYIGRNPGNERVFVHTGDSGQGMTHGVVGALMNSALILERDVRWTEVYEPSRMPPASFINFVKENATAIKNFAEYLAPGELSSTDELGRGQGAIIRRGLTKVAAYRDNAGTIHQHSAACTHVGCHLHWNGFEQCWDCPCHGSQFLPDGTVINAPAISNLSEVADDQDTTPATRERA